MNRRKDRADCPSCGRRDVPIRYSGRHHTHVCNGASFKYDYCYGPQNYNYYMGGLGFEPFDNAALYARDRLKEMEKEMVAASAEYYERRIEEVANAARINAENEIRRLERLRDAALERELEREEARARFGDNDDYPNEAVIVFKYRYDGYGIAYTFCAIKVGNMEGWYTTNKRDRNWYTFEELVDKYLSKAVEVWYVTGMEKL